MDQYKSASLVWNRNVDIFKNGPIKVIHWCLKIEMFIYLEICTDYSQPLVFEIRNVDKSEEMDRFKWGSGVWN